MECITMRVLHSIKFGSSQLNNVLNGYELINFVNSEKLRRMIGHKNPSIVTLPSGHLNLATKRTFKNRLYRRVEKDRTMIETDKDSHITLLFYG